jgi:hypothetical protein
VVSIGESYISFGLTVEVVYTLILPDTNPASTIFLQLFVCRDNRKRERRVTIGICTGIKGNIFRALSLPPYDIAKKSGSEDSPNGPIEAEEVIASLLSHVGLKYTAQIDNEKNAIKDMGTQLNPEARPETLTSNQLSSLSKHLGSIRDASKRMMRDMDALQKCTNNLRNHLLERTRESGEWEVVAPVEEGCSKWKRKNGWVKLDGEEFVLKQIENFVRALGRVQETTESEFQQLEENSRDLIQRVSTAHLLAQ